MVVADMDAAPYETNPAAAICRVPVVFDSL
jgi:hypothetical protein